MGSILVRSSVLQRIAIAMVLVPWACSSEPLHVTSESDADADLDGDADLDMDQAGEDSSPDQLPEEPDTDLVIEPGPLTLVVTEAEVLIDRLCDHDGDGDFDNAVADLGSPHAEAFAMVLNSNVQGNIDDNTRLVAHFPWLDDATTPHDLDAVMILFDGEDLDSPADRRDDFRGREPFYARGESLDRCGEPRFFLAGTSLDDGELTGSDGTVPIPFQPFLIAHGASVTGTLGTNGWESGLTVCAYSRIRDLGGEHIMEEAGDLSMLEIYLAGGAAFGITMMPGLSPDVDLDDDGLERFILDEDLHIHSCVDGDGSETIGRDCWRGEGMADAFASALRVAMVPAAFAGRAPGWQSTAHGECEEEPEESLFDPRP